MPGAAGAVGRLLERDVEGAAELGRAELQRTVYIDLEYALSVGQTHRGVRREGDGRAGGIVRAVPVDHRIAATEHQRTADELAVEVKPRSIDIGQRVTLYRCAAECCLAGEPTALAAADLAVENDGNVNVGQARAHRAVAQRRADAGAAEDELVDRHAGTAGQQHALGRAALDEHVAADREHAGDVGAHDAAQARFVVQQVDYVVAGAGGNDDVLNRHAVAVVRDLQTVGAQRDAVDAAERHIAFDLHGIAASRAVDLVQQDGAAAASERHADATRCQAGADAAHADAQVGRGVAACRHRFRLDRQRAGQAAKSRHRQRAAGDDDFLQRVAVIELDGHRAAADGDALVYRLAQGIDAHCGRRAEADAGKTAQGCRAAGDQRIAGLAEGVPGDVQAEVAAGHRHARTAGAKSRADGAHANQQRCRVTRTRLLQREVAADLTEAVNGKRHVAAR